jgi:hypothetical protein
MCFQGTKDLSALDIPLRASMVRQLHTATRDNPLDILVIGGGATGTGTALDAVTRCVWLPHEHACGHMWAVAQISAIVMGL